MRILCQRYFVRPFSGMVSVILQAPFQPVQWHGPYLVRVYFLSLIQCGSIAIQKDLKAIRR